LNLGSFVGPICTLGLLDYLTRSLSARKPNALHQATLAWLLMSIAACIGAVLLVAFVAVAGLQLGSPFVLAAAVGSVLLTPTQGLLLTVLRGNERMGLFAAVTSIGAAATNAAPLLVLLAGGGLSGYALSVLVMNILCVSVGWWKSGVRLPRVGVTPRHLLALIPAGLPFLGWTLTMSFYGQVAALLLGMLAPSEVVGWHSAANRIVSIPIFVPALIVTPLLPVLSRCIADRQAFRRTLNASLRVTVLLTVPFCAATVAAAPAIPTFLGWPAEFEPASLLMTILAPQLTVVALDMMLGTALIALRMERKWLVVGLVACAVTPAWSFFAIPLTQQVWGNGGIGASVGSILTECVMLVGALILLPRGTVDRSIWSLGARTVIAAVPFILITRLLIGLHLWLPVALAPGGLIFAMLILALKVITFSEVKDACNLGVGMIRSKLARPA
jgi:O-antigen/teichoic acid export membrane protein